MDLRYGRLIIIVTAINAALRTVGQTGLDASGKVTGKGGFVGLFLPTQRWDAEPESIPPNLPSSRASPGVFFWRPVFFR